MITSLRSIPAALVIVACAGHAAPWAAGEPPAAGESAEQEAANFLTIGDPAPALDAAHWLRGDEITYLEPGRIHVILFWSTWCKFCQASFPSLSEIQATHQDDAVVVAAISDEKLQTVFEFLAEPERGEQARFAIATDPDLSVQRSYMEAAAIGDIPVVFLVGPEGVIEWIGHPRKLAEPLQAVIAREWDRERFKVEFEEDMAPARARYARMRDMKLAYEARNWGRLLELFDQAIETDERPAPLKLQRFLLMIGEMAQPEEGYGYGRSLLREFWDDAFYLNQLAWLVVDHETVEDRDLHFARKAAERACDLTGFENAAILDTLARVHYEEGDLAEALEWQRKAIDHLDPADPLAPAIRAALSRYKEEIRRNQSDDDGGGE